MSPAESAEVQAWARREWLAACAAFMACCGAAGVQLDAATIARVDFEVRQIVLNEEHCGLSDIAVLRLAHARACPDSVAKVARVTEAALARMRKGGAA